METKKLITLKEWKQLSSSVSNSRLVEKIYPEFKAFYIEHCNSMTFAEDTAFRQLGYKLQQRVKSFNDSMKNTQDLINSLK